MSLSDVIMGGPALKCQIPSGSLIIAGGLQSCVIGMQNCGSANDWVMTFNMHTHPEDLTHLWYHTVPCTSLSVVTHSVWALMTTWYDQLVRSKSLKGLQVGKREYLCI